MTRMNCSFERNYRLALSIPRSPDPQLPSIELYFAVVAVTERELTDPHQHRPISLLSVLPHRVADDPHPEGIFKHPAAAAVDHDHEDMKTTRRYPTMRLRPSCIRLIGRFNRKAIPGPHTSTESSSHPRPLTNGETSAATRTPATETFGVASTRFTSRATPRVTARHSQFTGTTE